MKELTENQQKVLTAIQNGATTNEQIADQSGIAKGSITAIVNSLIKRELIIKHPDAGIVSFVKTTDENNVSNVNSTSASDCHPEPVEGQQPSSPATNTEENGVSNAKEAEEKTDPAPRTSHPETRTPNPDTRIAILIPYLKSEAAGDELKYALRAWEKNFKEDFRVIVIGDSEDWFSPEVVHIPHEPHLVKEICNCPSPSKIRNPQADINHKLFTAITAEELTGPIIYTNDDIFVLGATELSDLLVLRAFHEDLETSGNRKGLYAQNNKRTAQILAKNGLATKRFGTHTPVVFEAEKLVDTIEKYDALENGYPVESLYFNEHHAESRQVFTLSGDINDPILASVYRSDVSDKILDKIFAERQYINCDSKGWKSIKDLLGKHFPEKSRFEK